MIVCKNTTGYRDKKNRDNLPDDGFTALLANLQGQQLTRKGDSVA